MILLGGIRSEPSLALVADALRRRRARCRVLHQRDVARQEISWHVDAAGVGGVLTLGRERIDLATVAGVYLRLMDEAQLPEHAGLAPGDEARRHARAFQDALYRWAEIAPARVVNRSDPQGSNGSKPFQAQLIAAHGLLVPPTLVTNDPDAVLAFRREHGRVVYKSMSGVRSIVRVLEDIDLARLDRIGWCPVQFQAALDGVNVRVHVIGERVFPTAIESTHLDYRYAGREGGRTTLRAATLPDEVAARCRAVTRALGLAFAGVDLMRTDAGWYCFEVNPQPAFAYFEANAGQPIAAAVARYLARGD